jgi:hypothetical protein
MRSSATFEKAARLIEELLSVGTHIFDLNELDDLEGLITGLKDSELALICRVLALVVYDGDEGAISTQNMNRAKRGQHDDDKNKSATAIIKNHELLLKIPSFLPRMVGLLNVKENDGLLKELMKSDEFKSMFRAALSIYTNDDQEHGVHNILAHAIDLGMFDQIREAIAAMNANAAAAAAAASAAASGTSSPLGSPPASADVHRDAAAEGGGGEGSPPPPPPPPHPVPTQANFMNGGPAFPGDVPGFPLGALLNMTLPNGLGRSFDVRSFSLALYQVEVLFVLSTLSGGKQKREVQTSLAAEQLGSVLCALFDHIQWDCSKDNTHVRVHGPGCECNPESALRIQYLRLVRNFSENSESYRVKRTLFSQTELYSLRELAALHNEPAAADLFGDGITLKSYTTSENGLMIKMLETIQKPSEDSNHKIFMASAIEGYLRGASLTDRVMLVNHGLLTFIFDEVLKTPDAAEVGFKPNGLLQSLFDLLGELLKFSPKILQQINEDLSGINHERLVDLAQSELVSSNVFIRSLFLTCEDAKVVAPAIQSQLGAFVMQVQDRTSLVKGLIGCTVLVWRHYYQCCWRSVIGLHACWS